MAQPILSLIQVFYKMYETEIKHELLMEIYKESLRTIWTRLYYLLKIDENFVKGQYEPNHILVYDFFAVPWFKKPGK